MKGTILGKTRQLADVKRAATSGTDIHSKKIREQQDRKHKILTKHHSDTAADHDHEIKHTV